MSMLSPEELAQLSSAESLFPSPFPVRIHAGSGRSIGHSCTAFLPATIPARAIWPSSTFADAVLALDTSVPTGT